MHAGWIGLLTAASVGFIGGGAYAYVEATAGQGEARNAIEFGTNNYAGVAGAAVAAPVKALQEVKPSLQAAAGEVGGVLSGGTTPTTAAGEYGDPSEGGAG